MKKTVFYELNPRYFKDNSGNGIGDLKGLINQIDYFKFLGVKNIIVQDVISVDNVEEQNSSFVNVASDIGTLTDFDTLVENAKQSDINIFIELNIGSISENSDIFNPAADSSNADFTEMIKFHDDKANENFKFNKKKGKYYEVDEKTHLIQLDWENQSVKDHYKAVANFWNKRGIAGIVLKNFEGLRDNQDQENLSEPAILELRKLFRSIKDVNEELLIIGSTNTLNPEGLSNLTNGSSKVFDFVKYSGVSMLGTHKKFGLDKVGKFKPKNLFKIIDHIQDPSIILSLDSRFVGRYISRWVEGTQFINKASKAFAILQGLGRQSFSIYYGNEIAMENIGLNERGDYQDDEIDYRRSLLIASGVSESDYNKAQSLQHPINSRNLMSWNANANGGFSVSEKTISHSSYNFAQNNVAEQFADEHSTINFYKGLIQLSTFDQFNDFVQNNDIRLSWIVPGVLKYSFGNLSQEINIYVNITKQTKRIKSNIEGRVTTSSYSNKKYTEVPNKLEAYEAIVIIDNVSFTATKKSEKVEKVEEVVEKTQKEIDNEKAEAYLKEVMKLESAQANAKKEKEELEAVNLNLEADAFSDELDNAEIRVKGENDDFIEDIEEDHDFNIDLEYEKEKARREREAWGSFKDEATKLEENELAKTTLINDENKHLEELTKEKNKNK